MTMVSEGEILNYDYIFCPLCDYRTSVATWSFGKENAQGALASHLCRKKHAMSRRDARKLAQQQQVVPKGTLMSARAVDAVREETDQPIVSTRV